MLLKIHFLQMSIVILLSTLGGCIAPVKDVRKTLPKQPNIIVILMDDMGIGDIDNPAGHFDQDDDLNTSDSTNTPRLSELNHHSATFTDFYATASVCSPTRAALLTGRHPREIGITTVFGAGSGQGIADFDVQPTLAQELQSTGYMTGITGKWHLGERLIDNPINYGFDTFRGYLYSNQSIPFDEYHDFDLFHRNPPLEYVTENITNYAKDFIDMAVQKEKSFFLYIPHIMPHVPLYTSPKFSNFTGKGLYHDVMAEIDWSVGEILEHLNRLGVRQNTIIIFTSDNGAKAYPNNFVPPDPVPPYFHEPARWAGGSNSIHAQDITLKGAKRLPYEGGHRVPLIIHWDSWITHKVINSVSDTTDLYSTIKAIAGLDYQNNDYYIIGNNLLPILVDEAENIQSKPIFFYKHNTMSIRAVRLDNFKLFYDLNTFAPTFLVDLMNDPSESTKINIDTSNQNIVDTIDDLARSMRCVTDKIVKNSMVHDTENIVTNASITVSSSHKCHTSNLIGDGKPETFWEPNHLKNAWIRVEPVHESLTSRIGISFGEQHPKNVSLEYFSTSYNRWQSAQIHNNNCNVDICFSIDGRLDKFKVMFDGSEPFRVREIVAYALD